jgi:hypothetical protein
LDKKYNSLQQNKTRTRAKKQKEMGRRWELVEQQSKSKANSHTSEEKRREERKEKGKDVCATTRSNFESCTNSMTQKNKFKKYKNTNKRGGGGGGGGGAGGGGGRGEFLLNSIAPPPPPRAPFSEYSYCLKTPFAPNFKVEYL